MRLPVLFILMPMLLLVTENQFGLLYLVADYNIIKFIISFLILDIAMYWWHRFNHKNQFLWRFHFVHHVDTHMDVGTSLRFHIGELILSTLYKSVIILFLELHLQSFYSMRLSLYSLYNFITATLESMKNLMLPIKIYCNTQISHQSSYES